MLKGQNDIFFFDITDARNPRFLKSTRAPNSSITDDFLALPGGGFLVTNMGSASGGAGGRLVEFDKNLNLVAEHPSVQPADGKFNPHGIDADFSRNLLVTADFVNPVTTLNVVPGGMELRSSLRFWDLRNRSITRSVFLPDNAGTMDVKLIPGDKNGRAVTVNMFTGRMYSVDPTDGSYEQAFDLEEDITPHVATPVRGGMAGLLAVPKGGRRLIFATFMAGQVGMLDISNPKRFEQLSVVSFGMGAGPHSVHLTHDDKRLVVTDYFLNQDDFGKVHAEGDHKVHVLDVGEKSLTVDPAFQRDRLQHRVRDGAGAPPRDRHEVMHETGSFAQGAAGGRVPRRRPGRARASPSDGARRANVPNGARRRRRGGLPALRA